MGSFCESVPLCIFCPLFPKQLQPRFLISLRRYTIESDLIFFYLPEVNRFKPLYECYSVFHQNILCLQKPLNSLSVGLLVFFPPSSAALYNMGTFHGERINTNVSKGHLVKKVIYILLKRLLYRNTSNFKMGFLGCSQLCSWNPDTLQCFPALIRALQPRKGLIISYNYVNYFLSLNQVRQKQGKR